MMLQDSMLSIAGIYVNKSTNTNFVYNPQFTVPL